MTHMWASPMVVREALPKQLRSLASCMLLSSPPSFILFQFDDACWLHTILHALQEYVDTMGTFHRQSLFPFRLKRDPRCVEHLKATRSGHNKVGHFLAPAMCCPCISPQYQMGRLRRSVVQPQLLSRHQLPQEVL